MIFLTGGNGYLANLLCNYISHIDYVAIFGCPSSTKDIDSDPKKLASTLDTIVLAKEFKHKVIFASSVGSNYPGLPGTQGYYNRYKNVAEHYITNMYDNYLIYKIPRVYGPNKVKGIFKTLKDGTYAGSLETKIDYINEDDFVTWFMENLSSNNKIIEYNKDFRSIKVKDLKDLILNNTLYLL
ncbi:hypothetical phage protein [Campylobacter phage CPt10]|uniref:NAD-dependent epimerase/dehydratase domain-containing protein n=2 Tax=Firehammervirus CPt10 TaxID=722418 RepID=A0A410T7G9_9CAUD|nr:hypothetical protein APL46_gp013 [Campylobacter phage CPt10]QAU04750.1 hypothetical protein [Campylobacter phage CP20]CBJ94215.1 hypothetical phage protein [Campylobacter phage CPt10]